MGDKTILPEPVKAESKAQNKGLILGLLTVAMFMVVIDFSIIQIAIPTIEAQFKVPLSDLQWIVTGYSLTYAGFLMLSGRIGDIYGRKRLFVAGLLLFSVASLAGGFAPNLTLLIAARIIQGIGAAVGSATGLSIMMATFPEGPERNRALSIFSAILSSGFAAGVVLGGFMTSLLGWRSVLLVNVPIGIIAAALSMKYLSESNSGNTGRHIDFPGAVSITLGLIVLVYALVGAESYGLLSLQVIFDLILAFIILAAFFLIESRSRAPLVPIPFLRRESVLTSNSLAMILSATVGGFIFVQTIFLQEVLNYSPSTAGLLILPEAIIFMLTSGYFSSRLVGRFGAKMVISYGMALAAAGFVVLTTISISGGYLFGLLPGMLIVSTGAGLSWTAISIIALEGAKKGEEGLASGVFNTSIQVGGPLGLAILLTIAAMQTAGISGAASPASLVVGFQYAFVFAALLAAAAFGISLRIKSKGKTKDITAEGEIDVPAAPPGMSGTGMILIDEED